MENNCCNAHEWHLDNSASAHRVSVPCLLCGKMGLLAEMWIDRLGPAFKAYYHEQCKQIVCSDI